MRTVFLYEFMTAGGRLGAPEGQTPSESLLAEGGAMSQALLHDLRGAGFRVVTIRDGRLSGFDSLDCDTHVVSSATDERRLFGELAGAADATLIIAPELEGALLSRVRRAVAVGGRLLSPGAKFVALAADKQRCAEHLRAANIAAPIGVELGVGDTLPAEFPYPAVIKPNDGCGSVDVQLVRDGRMIVDLCGGRGWRLEPFCPGIAVSVAVLSGTKGCTVLPACRQRLSEDGRFQYLGGEYPLPPELNERAGALARRVAVVLPPTQGYFGIDMVLGATERDDVVIEVNPRLTTSYVGLRAATNDNLAEAMLRVAAGKDCSLSFSSRGLEFDADGAVRRK